jgi:hypothetical protein
VPVTNLMKLSLYNFEGTVLNSKGMLILYGRDTSDYPICFPILPYVESLFKQVSHEQLPTKDVHTHSLSTWIVK